MKPSKSIPSIYSSSLSSSTSRSQLTSRSTSEVGMMAAHDHTGSNAPSSVFIHLHPSLPIIVGVWFLQHGFVSSLVQGGAVVYALGVWLQSRLTWRKASQINLRLGGELLILACTIFRSSLVRTTSTEDTRLYPYIRQVNYSNCYSV